MLGTRVPAKGTGEEDCVVCIQAVCFSMKLLLRWPLLHRSLLLQPSRSKLILREILHASDQTFTTRVFTAYLVTNSCLYFTVVCFLHYIQGRASTVSLVHKKRFLTGSMFLTECSVSPLSVTVVFLFVFSGVRWARMNPKVFVYFIQLFLWIVTCIHGYDYKQLWV